MRYRPTFHCIIMMFSLFACVSFEFIIHLFCICFSLLTLSFSGHVVLSGAGPGRFVPVSYLWRFPLHLTTCFQIACIYFHSIICTFGKSSLYFVIISYTLCIPFLSFPYHLEIFSRKVIYNYSQHFNCIVALCQRTDHVRYNLHVSTSQHGVHVQMVGFRSVRGYLPARWISLDTPCFLRLHTFHLTSLVTIILIK